MAAIPNEIDRQKIDCNCNDCKFMQRDSERFKASIDLHLKWQSNEFNQRQKRMIDKANEHRLQRGDLETWDKLIAQAEKLRFQFDKKTAMINYGYCTKLNKQVSFIPNHCQLDTQNCFIHRKEIQ